MAYIVDHANNTLLDDEPKKVGKLTPKQHKQMMNYLVRKKDAVPPKTETIKKFKNGGSLNELGERLEDMYDLYDNDKPLSASREKYLRDKYFPKPFNNNDRDSFPSNKDQQRKMKISEKSILDKKKIKKGKMPDIEIKLASDYGDPAVFNLDAMQSLQQAFDEWRKSNTGSFDDFLDSLSKDELMNLTKETTPLDEIYLANALGKIANAMNGLSGLMARRRLNNGGSSNKPPIIKIEDYMNMGLRLANLSEEERKQIAILLKKSGLGVPTKPKK